MYNNNFKNGKDAITFIEYQFDKFYRNKRYQNVPSVKITSGFDPTVRFIGSHISVLKSFLNKGVPKEGVYIKQNCIRTWNANKLKNKDFHPSWGSYFTSIGTLSYPNLDIAFNDMTEFILESLAIPKDNTKLRVSAKDKDLLVLCQRYYPSELLEIDSMPEHYYRHKIGDENIFGRNFNIAIANLNGDDYFDIGNFIVLETDKEAVGIEMAIGTSTIAKEVCGLDHILECYPMNIGIDDKWERVKFVDSLMTSSILINEGLVPSGSNNKGRILRKYLEALSFYSKRNGVNNDELVKLIGEFANLEELDSNVSKQVMKYLN